MADFISTYRNKMDGKRRVSVPAPFRLALEVLGAKDEVVCYPSLDRTRNVIEVSTKDRFSRLRAQVNRNATDRAGRAAYGFLMRNSRELTIDKDGRISLPEDMADKIGVSDQVVFSGEGAVFYLWEPAYYDQYNSDVDFDLMDMDIDFGYIDGDVDAGGSV